MSRTRNIVLALLVLLSPVAAKADLIKISATSQYTDFAGDFEVVFEDDDDGLLQWDEIVSFSGILCFACSTPNLFNHTIFSVPDFEFGTASYDPSASVSFAGELWVFGNDDGHLGGTSRNWVYEASSVSVPEPSTLALFGLGLLGLGAARRRRKA